MGLGGSIGTLLADLQAAFQEYDINLPDNHAMQRLKEERDRALERALRMERERDEALRARDTALKLAEESYGELKQLMDSRARRIHELRSPRDTSNSARNLFSGINGSNDRERDRDREMRDRDSRDRDNRDRDRDNRDREIRESRGGDTWMDYGGNAAAS